jgi:hypothetical protein
MRKTRAGINQQLLPACDCGSVCNLTSTILRSFGVAEPPSNLLPAPQVLQRLESSDRVVLLVLDALGYLQLRDRRDDAGSVLAGIGESGFCSRITTVFPSTTTAALTSLYTGYTPQEHGVLGYRLYLKEYTAVADMLMLSPAGSGEPDLLVQQGMRHHRFLGVPTVFERLRKQGVPTATLCRGAYAGSGLSRLLHRGADRVVPVVAFSDLCVQVRKLVNDPDGPRFILAYWDTLDGIAHHYGPDSEEFSAELRNLGAALESEWVGHPEMRGRNVALVIAADHGQLEADTKLRVETKRYPWLLSRLLVPPTGDGRAAYLHCHEGEQTAVRRFLRDRFGDLLPCTPSDRLLQRGLFGRGKLHRHTRDRIGDFVVLPEGRATLESPFSKTILKGRHGGLSPEEMLVPLICTSL